MNKRRQFNPDGIEHFFLEYLKNILVGTLKRQASIFIVSL